MNHGARFEGEMDPFGVIMKERDETQVRLEEKKLAFEELRLKTEKEIRDEDRMERRSEIKVERQEMEKDRESRERVEIRKFKMMMDMLKDTRK